MERPGEQPAEYGALVSHRRAAQRWVEYHSGWYEGWWIRPSQGSNNPTYEFYPPKNNGGSRQMGILQRTVPLSLFPIAYLMSSGEVFVQAGREAILWNYSQQSERGLPNIPVPPCLPCIGWLCLAAPPPDTNYRETILFCGGMSLGKTSNWGNEGGPAIAVSNVLASTSCEQISPIAGGGWQQVDDLPQGRSMGQFIQLPDGTLWFGNGVTTGVVVTAPTLTTAVDP